MFLGLVGFLDLCRLSGFESGHLVVESLRVFFGFVSRFESARVAGWLGFWLFHRRARVHCKG